jgi:acetate kinase
MWVASLFCGGIGENSWRVRERVLDGMEWLGIDLDRAANRSAREVISADASLVRVFVIRTDEEAMIARHAADELSLVVAA